MSEIELKRNVDTFLETLKSKQLDNINRTTFKGSAMSKTEDNVNLATEGGLLEIPISEIEAVEHLSETRNDLVSITLKNPQTVKLRKPSPINMSAIRKAIQDIMPKTGESVAITIYTDSASGGEADDCSDALTLL